MKEEKHPGYPYQDGNGCWHQAPPKPWSTTLFFIWLGWWALCLGSLAFYLLIALL